MDGRPNPFATRGGIALYRHLVDAGYDQDDVRRHLRSGRWIRIRRGAYAEAAVWNAGDDAARHLLRARAVLAALKPPATLSHVSAAVALGLPVWGVDLGLVHVTRPGRSQSRHDADVVHHNGLLPPELVDEVDGVKVTRADRTVIDLARLAGFESGVVTADAALNHGLTTKDALRDLAIATADWPGSRVVGRVVWFADRRPESVGESRTRVLMYTHGLPVPTPQVEIWGRRRLLGRVDLLVEEAMAVIEFDGRIKYRLAGGTDPGELERILWAEKRREDDLRGEGYLVDRVVWSDFDRPRTTAARLRAMINLGLQIVAQRSA